MAYTQKLSSLLFNSQLRIDPASYAGFPLRTGDHRSSRSNTLMQENEHLRHELARHVRMAQRLRRERIKAESDSRMKSEFFANISHDVRLPVNSIIGMTELLLDTALTDEQREYMNLVQVSADTLLTVVNNLLDLSRLEAGCLALEHIPLMLRDCLSDTLKTVALAAHRKQLELVCDIAPEVPEWIVGDPVRLSQVVINLVGNAVKFTEHGSVVLRVRQLRREDGRAWLHFAVIDSGIGIPSECRRQIFDPFSQAEVSTARRYGGTGLGLSIASRLVEYMGGRIRIESEPGQGSVFQFTLEFPLAEPCPLESYRPDWAGRHALVAVAHPLTRRWLADTLRYWNFEVDTVADAASATGVIELARRTRQPYDLALVDDGLTLINGSGMAVHRLGRCEPGVAAVIRLGSLVQRAGADTLAEGVACRRLTKPINPSELLAVIVSMVGDAGVTRVRTPVSMMPGADSGRQLNILVVDDDPISRRLAGHVLDRAGHRVVLAHGAAGALAAFDGELFNLVLMDVHLPDMSGFEITRIIRSRDEARGGRVPVIALTGCGLASDVQRCLTAGMDACLVKPLRAEELLRVIAQAVARGSSDNRRPVPPDELPRQVINRGELFNRLSHERQLLGEIVDLFSLRSAPLLEAGREALVAGDAWRFGETLHTLRGMFHSLSANGAVHAVENLEQMDIVTAPRQIESAYVALEQEVGRVRDALRRMRDEVGIV